jgi:hypothetical protein
VEIEKFSFMLFVKAGSYS